MHELSICKSIVDMLEAEAKEKKFNIIHVIWLEIGELAGVEADALQFNFPFVAVNSVAKDATLKIINLGGRAWCHQCQSVFAIKTYLDACPGCNLYNYQITQGKGLRILNIEVE